MTAQFRCAEEIEACRNHPERDKYPELHQCGIRDWVIESAMIWEEERKNLTEKSPTTPRFTAAKRAMKPKSRATRWT